MPRVRVLLCSVLVACGTSRDGPHAIVIAEAGDAPEPGASVVTHRADGSVIDSALPDATGRAAVGVEPGAFVSVVFPSGAIVTTVAPPEAGGALVVHGPVPDAPPVVAGALRVAPSAAIAADDFETDLGCTTTHVAALPVVIDINARCFGTDARLDVLVRAFHAGQLAGYVATRIEPVDGVAEFDPGAWQTTVPNVPVMLAGVAPALDWVALADGLPFAPQPITGGAPLWTGLAISGATLTWTAADVGADAVDLHLAGEWDVVLPPDASGFVLPAIAATLPTEGFARYLDSSALDGFAAISDLSVDEPLVVPPGGELRETR